MQGEIFGIAVRASGYRRPAASRGEIFGFTVRARNIGAGCIAGLRSIGGGEIPEFTKLLAQSRNEAMARMVEEAKRRGSNAIVGMRFDSGAIGQWSEICAYGTAVWISPVTDTPSSSTTAMVQSGLDAASGHVPGPGQRVDPHRERSPGQPPF